MSKRDKKIDLAETLSNLTGKWIRRRMADYREIGLFGSFVRDEPHETSDINLLVDFCEDASLFDLVGLALFLEEQLNRKVDVVSKRALRAELRETVMQEVAPV